MTDRAWFDAAKGDIPQWAASMPKDADGTTIDWDWVRSLDLAHGVGVFGHGRRPLGNVSLGGVQPCAVDHSAKPSSSAASVGTGSSHQ